MVEHSLNLRWELATDRYLDTVFKDWNTDAKGCISTDAGIALSHAATYSGAKLL